MRHFHNLYKFTVDKEAGILHIFGGKELDDHPSISWRREGEYVSVAATYGPLEIALRPSYSELTRTLSLLRPVSGLQMTRQVGTVQAYLSVGLQVDGTLLIRPTIVADARGHVGFNLSLSNAARAWLFDWLQVEQPNLQKTSS